mgnify:CR=1 FL=1
MPSSDIPVGRGEATATGQKNAGQPFCLSAHPECAHDHFSRGYGVVGNYFADHVMVEYYWQLSPARAYPEIVVLIPGHLLVSVVCASRDFRALVSRTLHLVLISCFIFLNELALI